MEGVGLVASSFKFFTCLGSVFAEEVGGFGMVFLDGMDISLRTLLGYLGDLRTFCSWAVNKGLLKENPVIAAMPGKTIRKRIMLAKRSRRKEQVLNVEDCEKLISGDVLARLYKSAPGVREYGLGF